MLRPAGGGLFVISTGKAEQEALQRTIYGLPANAEAAEIQTKWHRALERVQTARIAILGVPSDVGAGFLRGANMGPAAIRTALHADHAFSSSMEARGIVDVGDVFVVPQILHDDMLSESQIKATRKAIYPDLAQAEELHFPVSPLSITERALDLLFAINPNIRPLVLGGDHSCAWPVSASLARHRKEPWAIVQMDAHTDMLEERLGIKYCFGTWSFHASKLFDRPDKMVQVGIRATRHERGHWENTYGIRQFWADRCLSHPEESLDEILAHLKSTGAKSIYFSNDIDGTDIAFADATGTPEPNGLRPEFVTKLIERLGESFDVCAGDVMEVAPPIPRNPGGSERTVALAVSYLKSTIDAMLRKH
ncbi:MAG: arginase family protein [Polyangiaceae bacterium]